MATKAPLQSMPEPGVQGSPAFRSIVCGVDGSLSSRAAVRQAVALASPSTDVLFVCVQASHGVGLTLQSAISPRRADQALRHAALVAKRAGIDAGVRIIHSDEAAGALADAASDSDLLVVASHGGSRIGGILLGAIAAAAVHHADVPVLVARIPAAGARFPARVLVASDGSPDAKRGVELASQIARSHESRIYLLAAGVRGLPHAEELGRHALALAGEGGLEPTLLLKRGDPKQAIPEAAREEHASLVIVGSRGLSGARALGSVSERVACEAPCSVLVARPRPERGA